MKIGTLSPVSSLTNRLNLREHSHPEVTLSSPAIKVFLDYDVFQPRSLAPGVSVDDASTAMKHSHTNLKLIADRDNYLLGVISVRDINSVKVLSTASAMGVAREDLSVKDVMTPVSQLKYIKRDTLDKATVGDLVDSLEHEKQRFLVVIDSNEDLCGLVCADEIARLLGKQLDTQPVAHDFTEVFSALRK